MVVLIIALYNFVDCPQYAYIVRVLFIFETTRILLFSPALR